jgi:biotin operon repressor
VRAGRLISMVLILQRRGRVTAAELSEEFGVSIRTVLRDVQALHEAGIRVYTRQGAGGGIELIGAYRTILTGLSGEEASAVFLLGHPTSVGGGAGDARTVHGGPPSRARRKGRRLVSGAPHRLWSVCDECAGAVLGQDHPDHVRASAGLRPGHLLVRANLRRFDRPVCPWEHLR